MASLPVCNTSLKITVRFSCWFCCAKKSKAIPSDCKSALYASLIMEQLFIPCFNSNLISTGRSPFIFLIIFSMLIFKYSIAQQQVSALLMAASSVNGIQKVNSISLNTAVMSEVLCFLIISVTKSVADAVLLQVKVFKRLLLFFIKLLISADNKLSSAL